MWQEVGSFLMSLVIFPFRARERFAAFVSGLRERRRYGLPLLALIVGTSVLASQNSPERTTVHTAPPPRSAYAGTVACAECHQKEAVPYALTPHALDSAPADAKHILGSFEDGHNVLQTSDPKVIVAMTSDAKGFYQSGINMTDSQKPTGEAERFDIAVGSGRHAQTYLYWDDDKLYQLPASYWAWSREWVLSPGFPAGQVHFDREIVPRCLECHASYFKWMNPPANRYAKDSIVLGIECERCHGPGAAHAAQERSAATAAVPEGVSIVNPSRLARRRQLDLCALCHAGAVEPIGDPLRFQAGDDIRDYLKIPAVSNTTQIDVHGNQVGALEKSKCFRSSAMTCSTCHNVHRVQEKPDTFSARCQTCHQMQACGRFKRLGAQIRTRCIDCHMPLLDSAAITTAAGERKLHALLRAHQITIYPEAAQKVEAELKEK